MNHRSRALGVASLLTAFISAAGCTSSAKCPDGPSAPLGEDCPADGDECRYGYDIPDCGGRTVTCKSGTWIEKEHTDPSSPACFMRTDSGTAPDASTKPDASALQPDGGAACTHEGHGYAEGDVVPLSATVSCVCRPGGEIGYCTGAIGP